MLFKDLSYDLTSNEDHCLQEIIHNMLQKVELNVFIYNESSYFERKCSNVTDMLSVIQNNRNAQCVWIEVSGPVEQRHDLVQELGTRFGLHQLTIEDIQTIEERMKIEIFDDGIYLLMKMIYIREHSQTNIQQQQISFYLKDNLLITFQEKHTFVFLTIKQRLAHNRGRLSKLKSDYLFYCLVDIIVENYMIVLDLIGVKIGDIDAELMQMTSVKLDTLKLIYNIKHDMLHFRIMCAPLKTIIIKLQKAHDRLPRRDPFAVQIRSQKPMKSKRGRRRQTTRQGCISILQLPKIREQSTSPTRTSVLSRKRSRLSSSSDDGILLHEYMFMHLKKLHDHILQMSETIRTHSEMIEWLVHFYMALSQNLVQEAIKLFTMIQVVFHPMLFIHGINSENFDWVPQRDDYRNSYFIIWGILGLITLTMVTWFKIKKWF